jgi:lipoprotein signal peptidase
MKEKIKHLILLIFLVGIDQVVKYWVRSSLMNHGPIIIIPNKILNLQFCKNTGAVWGILSDRIDFLRILTLMILVIILFLYFKIPNDKRHNLLKVLAVFIVAGAIGNMIDRFFLGYVTDFIYFEFIDFPLFNVADCYLTVSSILLVIVSLFYYKEADFAFLEETFGKKEKENQVKSDVENEATDFVDTKESVEEADDTTNDNVD